MNWASLGPNMRNYFAQSRAPEILSPDSSWGSSWEAKVNANDRAIAQERDRQLSQQQSNYFNNRYLTSTGQNAGAGASANKPKSAGDLFEAISIERNPEVNAGIDDLLAKYKAQEKYKSQNLFNTAQQEVLPQMRNDMAMASRYGLPWLDQQLTSGNQQLRTFGEGLSDEYANMLDSTRAAQQGLMADRYGRAGEWNDYLHTGFADEAAGKVENIFGGMRGGQNAGRGFSTGAGSSSADNKLSQRWYSNLTLPYRQQAYMQDLANIDRDLGLQREYANADINRYGFDLGLQSSLRGNEAQVAQTLYNYAQNLRQTAPALAEQMLSVFGSADQLQNKLLQGDAQTLALIASLMPMGRYESLNYKPGVNYEQPVFPTRYAPGQTAQPNLPTGTQPASGQPTGQPANAQPAGQPALAQTGGVGGVTNRYGGVSYEPIKATSIASEDNTLGNRDTTGDDERFPGTYAGSDGLRYSMGYQRGQDDNWYRYVTNPATGQSWWQKA